MKSSAKMCTLNELVVGVPTPTVTAQGGVSGALVLVDLDAPVEHPELVWAALAARTTVVVGVTGRPAAVPFAAVLDLVLSEQPGGSEAVQVPSLEQAVAALRRAAEGNPRAALVTAAVLRQTAQLPFTAGLAAEAAGYSTLLAGPEFAHWLAERGPARPARADDQPRLLVERDADVLRLRLNRVVRRNAFDAAMRRALYDALQVALLDPQVRVELSGAGPVFSAGGDLDEFGSAADPATAWVVRTGESPAQLLAQLSERTVARVHGGCVGAGVELSAFAGQLIADPAATFRLPELAMGLLPGAGGTVSVTRRIGRWRTLWLALTGLPLDARTAQAWGLVDAIEVRETVRG